jgi:hypothetical protein
MIGRALTHALLTWLLPGLGHVLQKRYAMGLYFGLLVMGTYALGLMLGEGAPVSSARFPYHALGQWWALGPAWIGSLLGEAPAGQTIDRLELGLVYTTVAGILNVVVMVDAYEWARCGGRFSRAPEGVDS